MSDDQSLVSKGINAFAFELYKAMHTKPGNLAVSPFSMAITLTMAWAGSEAKTASQLAKALGLESESAERVVAALDKMIGSLQSYKDITLFVLNKVYAQKAVRIKKPFKEMCINNLKADAEEVDFKEPEAAVKAINTWVEKNSKGLFKNYLESGVINNETKLLFVSAAYFKAGWWKSFEDNSTKKAPFTMADGKKVDVPMLSGNFQLSYHTLTLLNAVGITLPYTTENYSMMLFLPNSQDGMDNMEQNLGDLDFSDIPTASMEVYVTVPKFKIEKSFKFKDTLMKMDIKQLFDKNADVSNITTETIFAHEVVQKTIIGFTEHGTEDGVHSGERFPLKSMCEPVEFVADRPFVFLVKRDTDVVFIGRISNPLK